MVEAYSTFPGSLLGYSIPTTLILISLERRPQILNPDSSRPTSCPTHSLRDSPSDGAGAKGGYSLDLTSSDTGNGRYHLVVDSGFSSDLEFYEFPQLRQLGVHLPLTYFRVHHDVPPF